MKGKKQMGKISVGVMVLAALFTLGMCKCGWASETGPIQEQGTTIGGGTIGEGEAHDRRSALVEVKLLRLIPTEPKKRRR